MRDCKDLVYIMTLNWYALRTKPRKEDIVFNQLCNYKLDVFYPQLKAHPINPRARKVKPYFPGYLFIRVEPENINQSYLVWMPHTLGLVCYGDEPVIIADHLITALERRLEELARADVENQSGLKTGDRIIIDHGPLKGYEGLFDVNLPGTERVRILLKFINSRRVPVEIPAGYISKKK